MESWMQWLGLLILGLVIVLIVNQIKSARARSAALQRLAAMMNFTYSEKADLSAELQATGFRLFRHGHSKKTSRLLTGRAGAVDVRIFDYRYVTGGGKNSRRSTQTVMLLTSDQLDLPLFELQPENLLHKVGQAFGMKDIDFDMYPEFSRRYLLRGPDEETVRNLFKTYILEFFSRNLGLHLEGGGHNLIIFRNDKRIPPQKLEAQYRVGLELHELLKSRT